MFNNYNSSKQMKTDFDINTNKNFTDFFLCYDYLISKLYLVKLAYLPLHHLYVDQS